MIHAAKRFGTRTHSDEKNVTDNIGPIRLDRFLSPPVVHDSSWPRRPIDSFVLAKLESESIAPSPDAEPGVLLRRLYFDLIGLPPTPQQYTGFLQRIVQHGS